MNIWRIKIIAKLVLSRLPLDYRKWSYIGIFKHGEMDNFKYAWSVLRNHFLKLDNGEYPRWKGLELGPGDGILSSLLAPSLNNGSVDLVDSGDFVNKNLDKYKDQINSFKNFFPDINVSHMNFDRGMDSLLSSVNSKFYSNGLTSLKTIKNTSYDLIFSQAVLEHIRHSEFIETMEECYRLLKVGGIMSHVIDFKDHLGGGLNNMRFPSNLWEAEWFASHSGFYTNRIKITEIFSICQKIGFTVEINSIRKFERVPIERRKLAKEFKSLSDYDLATSGVHLIMRKPQQ